MEVLTTDRHAKSQLSILLRELGYAARFHASAASLEATFQESTETKRALLIDLTAEVGHEALLANVASHPSLRPIGFQFFSSTPERSVHINAKFYSHSIILPAHAERAKLRLKNTLKPQLASKSDSSRWRPSASLQSSRIRSKTKRSFSTRMTSANAEKAAFRSPRYLVCRSVASIDLIRRIQSRKSNKLACLLLGEDGAEFELVCREMNYQAVGDETPLQMLRPDELCLEGLETLEREASRERVVRHVYLGRCDDYSAEAFRELGLFIDYLDNLRNPYLRLYLAHAYESEEFFQAGVSEMFKPLTAKMDTLKLPLLAERAEDISEICHTTIGSLRSAHPFLFVQQITNTAIDYLIEKRDELSHRKLIRILRNSIALSQKSTLCIEDIKNYGENDLTTQHLLESMADENFFPTEQSANF